MKGIAQLLRIIITIEQWFLNILIIWLILLIAFVLRLPGLSQSLWLDEAAQTMMSSTSFSKVWMIGADFHPPLFHYLLHFWMIISTNEIWMRFLPLIFGLATVYCVYLFASVFLKSKKIALVAALLMAVSPYHIWYSQELRSYSLVTLLTMMSVYYLAAKRWKTYAFINLLAFFSNYIYAFVIAVEFTYLLFEERRAVKRFFWSQVPLLLAFILWRPQFQVQLISGQALTVTHPEWRNLSSPNFLIAVPLTIAKFIFGRIDFENNILYLILIFLMLALVFGIMAKVYCQKKKEGRLLLIQLLVPIVLAWFTSFWIPLNGPWRLILVLPFMYLLVAYYIEKFNDKHLIYIFLTVSFFGIFMQNYLPKNKREDWRSAVEFINNNTLDKKRALAVFEFIAPFAPWQWYEKNGIASVGAVPEKANEKDLDVYLAPALNGKKQIYLFEYFADVTDPNRLVRKYLEARYFKVTNVYEFNNLGFVYEMRRPYML